MLKEIKSKYLNQEFITKYGSKVKVIKAFNNNTLLVTFNDTFTKSVDVSSYKKGNITSPYCKTVRNVGFIGEGSFKVSNNGKATKCYNMWKGMFERCYTRERRKKYLVYIGVSVCDEWHNFQNFSEWFYENYYHFYNERMTLDKDILVKNNSIYSPETCLIVPSSINKLFITGRSRRGDSLIGVSCGSKNSYRVLFSKNGIKESFGSFKTEEEAFLVYKKEKEKHIKEIADKYSTLLPQKVYKALINYKVDITD